MAVKYPCGMWLLLPRPMLLTLQLLVLALPTVSCASIHFAHLRVNQPPSDSDVRAVVPGQSDLTNCLAALGAPNSVAKSDDGQRYVLTWKWLEQSDWGFNVSVPLGDQSGSFNWQDSENQPQFVRLFFDQSWRLVDKAEG